MVVAVIAVHVMQAAIDKKIGVIAMRNGGVAAIWSMLVPGCGTALQRHAAIGR